MNVKDIGLMSMSDDGVAYLSRKQVGQGVEFEIQILLLYE